MAEVGTELVSELGTEARSPEALPSFWLERNVLRIIDSELLRVVNGYTHYTKA